MVTAMLNLDKPLQWLQARLPEEPQCPEADTAASSEPEQPEADPFGLDALVAPEQPR